MRTHRGRAHGPAILGAAILVAGSLGAPLAGQATPGVDIRIAIPGEVQQLDLADGSKLVGRVISDGDPVEFRLTSGSVLQVARANIRGLETMEGKVSRGRFWRKDPSSNRLFFGPTGRMVGQGHGYVAVFEAVFPSVSYGFHDRITLGGGTLMMGDFGENHPFWVLPKVNLVEQEKVAASVGALGFFAGDDELGVLYGVGTFGPPDHAVTLGVARGRMSHDPDAITAFQLGAEVRVHENFKLMTENYLISHESEYFGLFGGGVRFVGERLTADLGVGIPDDEFIILPLVNFVWNW